MKKITTLAAAATIALTAAAAQPSFPGGEEACNKYITENIKYPQSAKDNGIEGIVNVSFTVMTDGSIGSIKIVNMIDPDLEQEAIRLVKSMPKWTPAEKPTTVTLPIKFTLDD